MADPAERSPPPGERDLDDLRRLLLGAGWGNVERIERVEKQLEDKRLDPAEMARSLPKALALTVRHDDAPLVHTLQQPIAKALKKSVEKDPRPIADAIFPILGPAIRKAVASAVRGMVETLNAAFSKSLSPRAFLWRIQAWRTGKSFGEIVLLRTLVFRVDQVFLIHRETGLLLSQASAPEVKTRDPDLVSAMLTAIQDFVRDSFGASSEETVQALTVGEHTVFVEQGPHAILAASIRGTPPEELRLVMTRSLERIHEEMAEELAAFGGDAAPFGAVVPHLEACLLQARKKESHALRNLLLFLGGLALVLWIGTLIFNWYVRERRWDDFLKALDAEPGLVVTRAWRDGGKFRLRGLKDPLAVDPRGLVGELDTGEVDMAWTPYQAMEERFVRIRARKVLAPPGGVELEVENGKVVVAGEAPHRWIRDARRLAPAIPGVDGLVERGLVDADRARFDALRARIEKRPATPAEGPGVVPALRELTALGRLLDVAPVLEVEGPRAAEVARRVLEAGAPPGSVRVAERPSDGLERFRIVGAPR